MRNAVSQQNQSLYIFETSYHRKSQPRDSILLRKKKRKKMDECLHENRVNISISGYKDSLYSQQNSAKRSNLPDRQNNLN